MPSFQIPAGTTSNVLPLTLLNSSLSSAGYTGLAFGSTGLSITWTRSDGTHGTFTLVTMTEGSFTSQGFVECVAGNGSYQFCPTDASMSAGPKWTKFTVPANGAINLAQAEVMVWHTGSQTGDAFARLGAPSGASIEADIAAIFSRLGSPAGASVSADIAALLTAVQNFNNVSALATIIGPSQLEIPASGSIAYPFTMLVKDAEGHLLDLAGSPTITAATAGAVDRSSNLSAVTHAGTGQYTFNYTLTSAAAEEGISVKGTGTASSDSTSRVAYASFAAVTTDTALTISAIKAKTDLIATNSGDSPNAVTAQGAIASLGTQIGTAGAGLTAIGDTRIATLITQMAALYSSLVPTTVDSVQAGTISASSFNGSAAMVNEDGCYVGGVCVFLTGANAGLPGRVITSYTGTSRTMGFTSPFPNTPSSGNEFMILGCIPQT